MIETFFDLDQLVAAVEAVRGVSSLPIVALLTFDDDAETGGGDRCGHCGPTARGARGGRDRDEPRRGTACCAARARRDARLRRAARRAAQHRPREHRRRTRRLPPLHARVLRRLRGPGGCARRAHRRRLLRHDAGADRGDPHCTRRRACAAGGVRGARARQEPLPSRRSARRGWPAPCARASGSSASSSIRPRAARTTR